MLLGAAPAKAGPDRERVASVEGRPVAYRVLGSGGPAIVMISGLGDDMTTFASAASQLARQATVILYDRAGYGDSSVARGPRDARAADHELSALLDQSGIKGPYLLVGHSLGGLYAEYFAASHPDQVLGLVLEESRPADFTRRCESAGLSSCTPPALMALTLPLGGRAELAALAMTVEDVEARASPGPMPVLVLSRPIPSRPSAFDRLWAAGQHDLAAAYPGARQSTAPGGGHYIHRDQTAWFVERVEDLIRQSRQ